MIIAKLVAIDNAGFPEIFQLVYLICCVPLATGFGVKDEYTLDGIARNKKTYSCLT